MARDVDMVKQILLRCWRGKGLTLRFASFGLGMAAGTMGTAILGGSAGYFFLFLVILVLCTVIIWKQLEDIYFLHAVEEKFKEENNGVRITSRRPWMSTCFSKTLAIFGDLIAAVAVLPMFYAEKLKHSSDVVMDCIAGGIATSFMTAWLPFLLIVLGKFITKRKPKKHWEKTDSLMRRIDGLAEGSQPIKPADLPRLHSLKGLGLATAAICGASYFAIYAPLLPEKEVQEEAMMASVEETQSEAKDSTKDTTVAENTNETEETAAFEGAGDSESVGAEVNNPNGYGFQIKREYLDAYLDYASGGLASSDYDHYEYQKNEGGGNSEYAYFSICGMHNDCEKHGEHMPYLLLSSTNEGSRCGDEIYFCLYRPEKYREGWDIDVECLGNLGIFNCDLLSMQQVDEVNQLYVYAKDGGIYTFVHRVDMLYFMDDSKTYEMAGVRYKDKFPELSVGDYSVVGENSANAMLESGTIAEIKWFAMDEIEEARAYYEPYVVEE